MRSQEINKRLIYYAQPLPPQPVLDENGYETGEMDYSATTEPKPCRINVTPAMGEIATRQFGNLEEYDKILITASTNLDIKEDTVLWVDNLDTDKPYDYIVKKVARGITTTSYAIRKVNLND